MVIFLGFQLVVVVVFCLLVCCLFFLNTWETEHKRLLKAQFISFVFIYKDAVFNYMSHFYFSNRLLV